MIQQDEAGPTTLISRPGTIERAFQLARVGECSSLAEIERQLRREGFDNVFDHLNGTVIRSQLRRLLAQTSSQQVRKLQPS